MRLSLCIQTGSLPDLLATSGDYLRIWRVSDNEARQECLLNNVSSQDCTFMLQIGYMIWTYNSNSFTYNQYRVYSNHVLQNKSSEYCAPLTSFDWNETDTKILGTSSIDTTCTIWELQVKHTSNDKHTQYI